MTTPSSRKTVIVLGAGATLGAVDAATEHKSCRPPLDRTFFTELQRITDAKHREVVRSVINDVVTFFGPNFDLSLEGYLTHLEFMQAAASIGKVQAEPFTADRIKTAESNLRTALSAVLEMSTQELSKAGKSCAHHAKIVNYLDARDTIISFNYDCVVDNALRSHGTKKWTAKSGYRITNSKTQVKGWEIWDPDPTSPVDHDGTIQLLKLHGSLNWQLPSDRNMTSPPKVPTLKQRLHAQNGVPRFTIIPPLWNKDIFGDPHFERIWEAAELAIRSADRIAIVGFSFAGTDLLAQSLFRKALAGRKKQLACLAIANPSADDRRRTRNVFEIALGRKPKKSPTLVRSFNGIEEFASSLPGGLS